MAVGTPEGQNYENTVYLQDSDTGTSSNENGTLGDADFTPVTSDDQRNRLTAQANTRVVVDAASMDLTREQLGAELTRLAKIGSGMQLVNVDESDRQLVEDVARGHSNFSFAVERETAAAIKETVAGHDDEDASASTEKQFRMVA